MIQATISPNEVSRQSAISSSDVVRIDNSRAPMASSK